MSVKLNSPAFWDIEFEKEYKDFIGVGKGDSMVRFAPERFGYIGTFLPIKGEVLDVGCGLGHLTRFIKAMCPLLEVSGTDCSEVAVRHAASLDKQANYFYSRPTKIDTDKKYDAIVATEVLEHIEDDEEFLREIKRHLKPNGIVVLTTPIAPPGKKEKASVEHVREYYEGEFENLLSRFFKNVRIGKPPVKYHPEKHWTVNAWWQWGVAADRELSISTGTIIYY